MDVQSNNLTDALKNSCIEQGYSNSQKTPLLRLAAGVMGVSLAALTLFLAAAPVLAFPFVLISLKMGAVMDAAIKMTALCGYAILIPISYLLAIPCFQGSVYYLDSANITRLS